MGFFLGFMLGGRGPSDSFLRAISLMLAWALPLGLGKIVAANVGAPAYAPASLTAYAVMIVFVLWRPAGSVVKLGLVDGAVFWFRLILIVFAVGALWNLYDAGFVLSRLDHLFVRDIAWAGAAIGVELMIRRWIRRDLAARDPAAAS